MVSTPSATWDMTAAMRVVTIIAVGMTVLACGATPSAPTVAGSSRAAPALSPDAVLFPAVGPRELRADRFGRHVALVADGHVYGSNGDDLPTMTGAAVLPVLLHEREPGTLRCATIGLGSAVEASALAALGCGHVDVLERRDELFANARALGEWVDERLGARASEPPFEVLREVPQRRYDVVVQSVATTLFERPARLFTVERLQHVAAVLAPGGILVQHLQLYEIQPHTHRRLVRTFAEVFPHVALFAPVARTSDTFLIGSMAPLALDLERAERLRVGRSTARWLGAMEVRSSFDWLARVLFASRAELLAYAHDAEPCTLAAPLDPAEMPLRPPTVGPDRPDHDYDRWDEENERFQAQFPESFLASFYEEEWPYGRACPELPGGRCGFVRSLPANPRWADLVIAHLAHDRIGWAVEHVERATEQGLDVMVAIDTAEAMLEPRGHAPPLDPLEPFPAGLSGIENAAKDAWRRREADPIGAARELEGLLASVRTPNEAGSRLRLATGLAWLAAGDSEAAWRALRVLEDEHAAFCDALPACWYAIGWAGSESDDAGAAWAFARYFELVRASAPAE